jgi:LPXTG-motif cell wall-anchored protein
MSKGYYIVGALLLGLGGYYLYNKIKNGNVTFNFRDESVAEEDLEDNLAPPMEVPPLATPPLV